VPCFILLKLVFVRYLKLLALEEAESEAALKDRLSTWSVDLLRKEGYCMTGLSAYWLKANQFGRPVAAFLLGPGLNLPESKFECVFPRPFYAHIFNFLALPGTAPRSWSHDTIH